MSKVAQLGSGRAGSGTSDGVLCFPNFRIAVLSQAEFVSGQGCVVLGLKSERDTATREFFTSQDILTRLPGC